MSAALWRDVPPVRSAGARPTDPCPCGSGQGFTDCCEPLLDGAPAPTAQALMRSRYTAFVVGDEDHLFRTWHPRTRPPGPYCQPGTRWLGLTVHECVGGGGESADGEEALVELTARYEAPDGRGGTVVNALHERSTFLRRAGRWLYVGGEHQALR
ncbi:YchJ family metal-binding protein [Actinomyces sp. W5033]|uniref:YchJ family protein n=1 Tax=Actinomyces sp. W5033 TaxID=3446479 RepID=UPI003EE0F21A